MSFGLKGSARDWGPGLVRVVGSFTVASSAIVAQGHGTGGGRPSRPGYTLTRKAAGVYLVTLTQAFRSVVYANARVGADKGFALSLTNLPVTEPNGAMITQDFFTCSATQLVTDSTNKNLVITTFTNIGEGTIGELTANYRCAFEIILAESEVNY